jgi:hypothetical protein
MASAWGTSWGSAWGNSWGSVGAVVTPPQPDVGGRIVGGTFTRKRWRELCEAREAQRELERQALELKAKTKKKLALDKAARVAEIAIDQASAYDQIHVLALTRALEAAASATRTAETIAKAKRVAAISIAIIREVEEEEDIELLLLH